jgi:hypothetical protein
MRIDLPKINIQAEDLKTGIINFFRMFLICLLRYLASECLG